MSEEMDIAKLTAFIEKEMKKQNKSAWKISQETGICNKTISRYLRSERIPKIDLADEILRSLGYRLAIVKDN